MNEREAKQCECVFNRLLNCIAISSTTDNKEWVVTWSIDGIRITAANLREVITGLGIAISYETKIEKLKKEEIKDQINRILD